MARGVRQQPSSRVVAAASEPAHTGARPRAFGIDRHDHRAGREDATKTILGDDLMRIRLLPIAVLSAAMLVAAESGAQPPNPLDAIPDTMPADIPYGMPIGLDRAEAAITAAVAESKKRNWKMNIAVVDAGGHLIAFQRMDGAQIASVRIAEHKARAAATFRRETKVFESAMQINGLRYLATLDDVIASRGGIPLIEGGKLVGAIGCSGGTGSQDEVVCKAGAATVK
jgi:uncharacterized protein GlcG (DUF336 family)